VRYILEREQGIQVVGEASDGREAVRLAQELSPDVIVMDIAMPNLNGIEAATQIIKRSPKNRHHHFSVCFRMSPTSRAPSQPESAAILLKDSIESEVVEAVQTVAGWTALSQLRHCPTLLMDHLSQRQKGVQIPSIPNRS